MSRELITCPAHGDRTPSLSADLNKDGTTILLYCWSHNCSFADIAAAWELDQRDFFARNGSPPKALEFLGALERREQREPEPADGWETQENFAGETYEYTDPFGSVLYQELRFHKYDGGKYSLPRHLHPEPWSGTRWLSTRGGVDPVLYNLAEVVTRKAEGVFVVEGPKDVETLRSWGLVATTSGSATSWRPEFAEHLRGGHVVVIPDNDDAGRAYAGTVVASLKDVAATVRVVELLGLAEKGDVSDWAAAGGTCEELIQLVRATEPERGRVYRIEVPTAAAIVDPTRLRQLGTWLQETTEGVAQWLSDFRIVRDSTPHLIQDLVRDKQIVLWEGEEGTGKTWTVWQVAGELACPTPTLVLGHFERPVPIAPVLIVDTEQTDEDMVLVRDEMLRRGAIRPADRIAWVSAMGRRFDDEKDMTWLRGEVHRISPAVLIIDAATDAVSDPKSDEAVKELFDGLQAMLRGDGLRAVILCGQPRKTGQGSDEKGRSFDSVFGSRVWKGRPSAVFWITPSRLSVWKQRGGYLRRRWGKPTDARHVYGLVRRPGESDPDTRVPTVVLPPETEEHLQAASESAAWKLRTRAVAMVQQHPDHYTKRSLADALGGKAVAARLAVDDLLLSGRIGPNKPKAKLSVTDHIETVWADANGPVGGTAAGPQPADENPEEDS